jgi:hypothetical protein
MARTASSEGGSGQKRRPSAWLQLMAGLKWLVVAALPSCGSSGESQTAVPSEHPRGEERVVLTGMTAVSAQGYDVTQGRVVNDGKNSAEADFFLSMTMIISLFPAQSPAGFCQMPGSFSSAAEIPVETSGCNWHLIDLGGNSPHIDDSHVNQGWLFQDRSGTLAGKLRMVGAVVEVDSTQVTFDFLRLPLE